MSGPYDAAGPKGAAGPEAESGPNNEKGPYHDIIDLPHHTSPTRARMPAATRAAQFSPFAALSGYDDAIDETARLTDARIELAEGSIAALDTKLGILADRAADRPQVAVTYFRPDERKAGGAYVTAAGAVKKVDEVERTIVFVSGERIPIADILEIEGGLFGEYGTF